MARTVLTLALVLLRLLPRVLGDDLQDARRGILAIFLLDTQGQGHGIEKPLAQIDKYIAPYTLTNVHVVVRGDHQTATLRTVEGLPLNSTSVIVNALEDIERMVYRGDFRSTAQEKLLVELTLLGLQSFAESLGYTYFLHLHHDFDLTGPIPFDMVATFKDKVDAAVRWVDGATAPPASVWGLPELLRYFLVTENIKPAGKLFNYCTSHDVEGLRTPVEPASVLQPEQMEFARAMGLVASPDGGGWRPPCPFGNFVVVNLKFWLSPLVRRFLNLCRMSAGARFRWREGGVYTAVLQALVPEARLHTFNFTGSHAGTC